MKDNIFLKIQEYLVYALYVTVILTCFNTCTTCTARNKIIKLEKKVDTLIIINDSLKTAINELSKITLTTEDIKISNDKQMSRYLYWEKKADSPEYNSYTPKDYEELIKQYD